MSILEDMAKPDRVSRRRDVVRTKAEQVLAENARNNLDTFGSESTQDQAGKILSRLSEDGSSALTTRASAREARRREREEKTARARGVIAEAVASIVVESLPLDEEAVEEFGDRIRANARDFVVGLLEEGTLSLLSFTESKSQLVKDLAAKVFLEPDDRDAISEAGSQIAEIVKEKARKAIKAEVRVAKAQKKLEDEIGGEEEEESGIGEDLLPRNMHRTRRVFHKGRTYFSRLLRETSAAMTGEGGDLDMDRAMGNAAVQFCIVETLNTMNVISDTEEIVDKILAA